MVRPVQAVQSKEFFKPGASCPVGTSLTRSPWDSPFFHFNGSPWVWSTGVSFRSQNQALLSASNEWLGQNFISPVIGNANKVDLRSAYFIIEGDRTSRAVVWSSIERVCQNPSLNLVYGSAGVEFGQGSYKIDFSKETMHLIAPGAPNFETQCTYSIYGFNIAPVSGSGPITVGIKGYDHCQ